MTDALIKAIKSLINDIEAMRSTMPAEYAEGEYDDSGQWFGDFSEYWAMTEGVAIEWPNLAISLEEVKQALAEQEPDLAQQTRNRHVEGGEKRPPNCRFRLQDEGKAYPRSSCAACGKTITTGLGKGCTFATPPSRNDGDHGIGPLAVTWEFVINRNEDKASVSGQVPKHLVEKFAINLDAGIPVDKSEEEE